MMIMGRDWHPRYQIVAWVEEETGEVRKQRLEEDNGAAEKSYWTLAPGAAGNVPEGCRNKLKPADSLENETPRYQLTHRERLRCDRVW